MRSGCGIERLLHALARGSADHVVAIERGVKRDRSVKIFAELLAKLAEFRERQLVQFDTFLQSVTNGVPDLFVRLAEGNAFVHKIGGRSHGVQIARLRGGLHAFVAETQSACESRQNLQHSLQRIGDFEDWLLRLLQVFIVCKRQPFQKCRESDGSAEKTAAFAAQQLGEIGILLLRHGA